MVKKVERRIQAISHAYLVSVPMEWIREHGLTKGSVVRIYYNGDLVIEAGSGELVDASQRRSSYEIGEKGMRSRVPRKTGRAHSCQEADEPEG